MGLAVDAGVELGVGAGLSRMALAYNVRDREGVDRVLGWVAWNPGFPILGDGSVEIPA